MSPRRLSLVALLLGVAAAVFDGFLFAQEENKGDLLWPLILLPVLLVPLPVLVPRQTFRVVCALGMTAWCFLTGLSIGPVFLPCLIAMWAAATAPDGAPREQPA